MGRGPALTPEQKAIHLKKEEERKNTLILLQQITGKKWKKITKNALEILKKSQGGIVKVLEKKEKVTSSTKFKEQAGYFLCEVRNLPFKDEECILYCNVKTCTFNGKGYFHAQGIKF